MQRLGAPVFYGVAAVLVLIGLGLALRPFDVYQGERAGTHYVAACRAPISAAFVSRPLGDAPGFFGPKAPAGATRITGKETDRYCVRPATRRLRVAGLPIMAAIALLVVERRRHATP